MALPRYVVLQSKFNKKYLRFREEDGGLRGFLQFTGDELVSPYTKYKIKKSKNNSKLVHIKCCYSNKYWAKLSSGDPWIVALTDEPNEDQSQWWCTLFEPVHDADHDAYRFRHVISGNHVVLWRTEKPAENCILAKYNDPDHDLCDLMTVIDCENLFVLPKYVAFKGDNDRYLRVVNQERHDYLEFSGTDIGDSKLGNEVFINSDGSVRIKSRDNDKFWRRSPNWIWADSTDTSTDNLDTVFWPFKSKDDKGNEILALRNLGNNNYCKRLTTEGKTSCLNAAVSEITIEAQLKVEELILSRDIFDLEFRVSDARTFDRKVITADYDVLKNDGNEKVDLEANLAFTDVETSTWSSTFTTKLGVKTTIDTGIPTIAKAGIEISGEISFSYTWGKTITSDKKISRTLKVSVPAKTKTKVSMIATNGRFNIPFSYTQRDILKSGKSVISYLDDGIFTGVNSYDFYYLVENI